MDKNADHLSAKEIYSLYCRLMELEKRLKETEVSSNIVPFYFVDDDKYSEGKEKPVHRGDDETGI
jgi:hypothetical protein